MFFKFPREVGLPRKVVFNKKEFLDFINLNNGHKDKIYTSLYTFTVAENNGRQTYKENSQVIDKIFFDFDGEPSFEHTHRFHEYCDKNSLMHSIAFSGGGFHCYIYCHETNKPGYEYLQNKKDTIANAQKFIEKEANVVNDEHVVGNIAQMARVWNTYNIKRKSFCIPLTRKQLENLSLNEIKSLAKKQNFTNDIVMNKKKLELKGFDTKRENGFIDWDGKIDINIEGNRMPIEIDSLPDCIKYLLSKKHPLWRERGFVVMYLRDIGLLPQETAIVMKKFLSERDYRHAITDPHGDKQIKYLYSRNDLLFPSCRTMREKKACPGKCKQYNKVIYK